MHSNQTPHYQLPVFTANDKPSFLADLNPAYQKIDTELFSANTSAQNAERLASTASNDVSQITDNVTENTTDITNMKVQITGIQQNVNNVTSKVNNAINIPNNLNLFSGLGTYLSGNNPEIRTNTAKFKIVSIFDLKLLNIFGSFSVNYSGTPNVTDILNFSELVLSQSLKTQLDAITSNRTFYNVASVYLPTAENRSENTLLILNQTTNKLSRLTTPQFNVKENSYVSLYFQSLMVL